MTLGAWMLADVYSWCFCEMKAIPEGEKVFTRDDRPVCESCAPLYDKRTARTESGNVTSKKALKPTKRKAA